ncbi:MAG: hypothetical protein RIE08_15715 [Acidimicrobiales bacterium]
MAEPLTRLGLASTAFFRSERAGSSHSILTMVLLEGPCDIDALRDAIAAQLDATPLLRSRVVNDGGPIWKRWAWCADAQPVAPRVTDLRAIPGCDDLAGVVDHIYDRGRRARNLSLEQPARVTVALLDDDRTVLALERHHAAADATVTYGFVRDALARYHRSATGTDPSWADIPVIHSRAGPSPRAAASRADLVRYSRVLQQTYPGEDVAFFAGTPSPHGEQITVRAPRIDLDTTSALRRRARAADGSTITDLAVVAAMRALHAWNSEKGASALVQRHSLPVAQRQASSTTEPNALSLITVGCRSDELAERAELLLSVSRQRADALGAGIDIALARVLGRLTPLSGLDLCARLAGLTAESAGRAVSCITTNPGILWPETVDGRLTGDSALTEVGDLRVMDTLSIFNGLGGSLRLTTFRSELRLDFAANTEIMSRQEATEISQLIHGELLGFL